MRQLTIRWSFSACQRIRCAKKLDSLLAAAGIELPDQQKQQLLGYVGMLDKWNKAYNLTSVRDPQQMLVRHILDSIVVNPHLQGSRFIDVGTGHGLPGIPLAIVRPDAHFTLLDSLASACVSCVRCSMSWA